MKVKVIYRNYIPLYSAYCSFWLDKIPGVEIEIPPVNPRLVKLYKGYRIFRNLPFFPKVVETIQKFIFPTGKESLAHNNADILFYTGICPPQDISQPFIIDFEHAYALFNYGKVTEENKQNIISILKSENCKKILPWSEAALDTFYKVFGDAGEALSDKCEVLYPALPSYVEKYKGELSEEFVSNNDEIKLLFVGKGHRGKGLIEVLEALKRLNNPKLHLYCISDLPLEKQKKYSDLNISFYEGKFKHEDLIKKFFMRCDALIVPTHQDTFGMVFLEALAAGIPAITTRQFACKEIVEDGVNGFFVESDILFLDQNVIPDPKKDSSTYNQTEEKMVLSIMEVLNRILQNPGVLKDMKGNCYKEFEPGGKFSISLRSEKLKRYFDETYGTN